MNNVAHVVPVDDLIEHDTSEEAGIDCVCGPRIEYLPTEENGDAWVIVHNSLDGRERFE